VRAWELRGFGWDQLVLADRPVPEPGPREVVVRVGGAALNSRDLQIIHDQYYPDQAFPIVLGSDGAGEVVAVGEDVERPAVGERVAGAFAQGWISGERTWDRWLTHLGGQIDGVFQEYVLLQADGAVPVPSHLTDVEAAAATSAAATAWRALVELGRIEPGQTVLVQGTGGVAVFALQFAHLAGARVVVTSSSDRKLERARELGAWATVNYRATPDWDEEVLRLTGGDGVDHVVETAGDLERSVRCLRIGGLISAVGYTGQLDLTPGAAPAWSYSTPIIPLLVRNVRLQALSCAPAETFGAMYRAMEATGLRPAVDRVFAFDELVDALRYLQAGEHVGKVGIRAPASR
jgi:NADPH:quinone reductase-like Zn-dependent oxidoreductase